MTAAIWENGGVRVEAVPTCPLCGTSGQLRYEGLRDRSWTAPGTWSLRECPRCGHLWLDPRPLPRDIGRLYSSYYTHGLERPSPLQGAGFWPMCRRGVLEAFGYSGVARDSRERFLGRAMRFVPPVWEECEEIVHSVPGPPRGRLFDVGCGDGYFLRIMRDLGWDVRGLEPDPRAAAVARAHGLEVVESPVEQAALPSDWFDVVTMSHVIEHVPDPISVLVAVRRMLSPHGTLLVFTPNGESWGHAMFGRSWNQLDPPRHLHIFCPRNLAACAERAGLQVMRLRTTGRLHLIFDASVSIRRTGRYQSDDPAIHASGSEHLFRLFESLLVRVHPRGAEELIMTCTKGTRG